MTGTRDQAAVPAAVAPRSSTHKSHRHAQRELLYTVVRESMIRAGVLSASYKFKVLSLDPRGDQFMVMMDLAQAVGGHTEQLADIEFMIAQSAKARYNIRVTAVYWRMNELVSVARPVAGAQAHSRPAPLQQAEAAPSVVAGLKPAAALYEPIEADEVAAFKQALAAASAQGTPLLASRVMKHNSPRSYTLLTGFEDTEMPESPAQAPALSATQYGELN
ncbi:hypothetical protein [Polaromonas sp. SM01]|uniref:hypothetical protein n=1 Tax=Polaromonas sp. SM01 TaxID=3085630 RepID=UPI002982985C|nr:hypothetical protein [Polaromonas sp. SM01]MDW5441235.1 hypothetical protein [Polaromonas sp. SM01]